MPAPSIICIFMILLTESGCYPGSRTENALKAMFAAHEGARLPWTKRLAAQRQNLGPSLFNSEILLLANRTSKGAADAYSLVWSIILLDSPGKALGIVT